MASEHVPYDNHSPSLAGTPPPAARTATPSSPAHLSMPRHLPAEPPTAASASSLAHRGEAHELLDAIPPLGQRRGHKGCSRRGAGLRLSCTDSGVRRDAPHVRRTVTEDGRRQSCPRSPSRRVDRERADAAARRSERRSPGAPGSERAVEDPARVAPGDWSSSPRGPSARWRSLERWEEGMIDVPDGIFTLQCRV